MTEIELRSDNAAGVAPEMLAAVAAANTGSALAYGNDHVTTQLEAVVRDVFEHPTARVFPVTSGTAANALALTSLCPPWGAVLCHESAHILKSEGGATSMLGGGAVMQGVAGSSHRVHLDGLQAALDAVRWGDPHHSQPAVLSLTQPTDMGTIYTVAERWPTLPVIVGCAFTSTGHVSPTQQRGWVAPLPTSLGGRESTFSHSAPPRMERCRPRRLWCLTTTLQTSSSTAPSDPVTSRRRCDSNRHS
jgi:hypothetical protein